MADGQLQPSNTQLLCLLLNGEQDRGEVAEVAVPESHCEPAMDDFLNTDQCPEKCH